jgi:hypothetical protein
MIIRFSLVKSKNTMAAHAELNDETIIITYSLVFYKYLHIFCIVKQEIFTVRHITANLSCS